MDFFIKMLRTLFFFLDWIIYSFIPTVYNFIEILSKAYIFDQKDLGNFAGNIYAIIAVFMLFRLAFVILNAIIDPDKLTSKEGGVSKMLYKLIIALFLIVLIPWGFDLAFQVQDAILSKQILSKVILGQKETSKSAGRTISRETLKTFITCNPDAVGNDCNDGLGTVDGQDLASKFNEAFPTDDSSSNFDYFWNNLNNETKRVSGEGDVFKLNYNVGISTICGGFILYLLIIFSFEVALRVVKLGFLQLFTPIAVVGYVDPKGKIFKQWLDMVWKTYLNLFIRLFAIYFMIYIIDFIPNLDVIKGYNDEPIAEAVGPTLAFIKVFIILGCLMFAKQAPSIISEMLGIKEGSLSSMVKNPFKSMLAGGIISGAIGTAVGGTIGLGAKGVSALGGGVSGALSSAARDGSKWAGFKQGASAAAKKVSLKGGFSTKNLGKQFSGVAGSWHAGAVAGASGAAGKETKVGLDKYFEHRQNVAADQQKQAVAKAQEARAANLYKTLENSKAQAADNPSINPYESVYKNKQYASMVNNIEKAKNIMRERELARQTAYNNYALNPNEQTQAAYSVANKNFVDAQKHVEYYKSELSAMDKMEAYQSDADSRSLIENYSSKVKAESLITKQPEQPEQPPKFTTPVSEQDKTTINNQTQNESIKRDMANATKTASGIILPGNMNNNENKK